MLQPGAADYYLLFESQRMTYSTRSGFHPVGHELGIYSAGQSLLARPSIPSEIGAHLGSSVTSLSGPTMQCSLINSLE